MTIEERTRMRKKRKRLTIRCVSGKDDAFWSIRWPTKSRLGLQGCQRCRALRHRGQPVHASGPCGRRPKEGRRQFSYFGSSEMRIRLDAAAHNLESKGHDGHLTLRHKRHKISGRGRAQQRPAAVSKLLYPRRSRYTCCRRRQATSVHYRR